MSGTSVQCLIFYFLPKSILHAVPEFLSPDFVQVRNPIKPCFDSINGLGIPSKAIIMMIFDNFLLTLKCSTIAIFYCEDSKAQQVT